MPIRQVYCITTRPLSAARRIPCSSVFRTIYVLPQRVRTPTRQPVACSRRHLTTPPPKARDSDIDQLSYLILSDVTMERMVMEIENLLDEVGDEEFEVEYGSGVLTLRLGSKGTYVINKQPPNKQIWLSSPFSGPKRYDYVSQLDQWVCSRDQRSLNDLLNQELSDAFGREVDLGLTNVSKAQHSL